LLRKLAANAELLKGTKIVKEKHLRKEENYDTCMYKVFKRSNGR